MSTKALLQFSESNHKFKPLEDKLGGPIISLSLLSGWTCPGASFCKAKVHVDANGKRRLEHGADATIQCFSASQELQYSNTFAQRKHNTDLLMALAKSRVAMFELLRDSFDAYCSKVRAKPVGVRIHVAGDMFNRAYLGAWRDLACARPAVLFSGYTKSLPYLVDLYARGENVPNLKLTASVGGRYDNLLGELGDRGVNRAWVVLSMEMAAARALSIDHDDSSAAVGVGDFALLLHGPQKKGSEAGRAVYALRKVGFTGYGRAKKAKSAKAKSEVQK